MLNTTLCYIYQGDRVLMLHRVKKENDLNRDKWIGLGGKFLEGETPAQCVLREIKEESGLTLTSYRYRGIVDFISDRWPAERMHLFTADAFTGELIPCEEGDLEWITMAQFRELPQWEGDKIFLQLLEEDAPFFRLKLEYEGEALVRFEMSRQPDSKEENVETT
ncbi:MAG: 8-oxo-dGTP diphosphatase [Lachnospiraceae bacterium]|nr:8-oxo-dGTP diphosphatase [Lachnospiraceae bacterium]